MSLGLRPYQALDREALGRAGQIDWAVCAETAFTAPNASGHSKPQCPSAESCATQQPHLQDAGRSAAVGVEATPRGLLAALPLCLSGTQSLPMRQSSGALCPLVSPQCAFLVEIGQLILAHPGAWFLIGNPHSREPPRSPSTLATPVSQGLAGFPGTRSYGGRGQQLPGSK